jgi:hypothetical protein
MAQRLHETTGLTSRGFFFAVEMNFGHKNTEFSHDMTKASWPMLAFDAFKGL